jgi:hypothetical protein
MLTYDVRSLFYPEEESDLENTQAHVAWGVQSSEGEG